MDDCWGPPLPPSFNKSTEEDETIPDNDDEEPDFTFGPLPPGMSSSHRHYQKPITKKEDSKDANKREEWMLSLPEMNKKSQLAQLQAGSQTTFRKNAVPSQDKSWTKNPQTNESYSPDRSGETSANFDFTQEYDREQEKAAKSSKKHKDKNDKSLLDLHREKLKKEKKKKKKDKKEKAERVPFSRETDLAWSSSDKKKSKAISSMAKPDSRFHSGSSKYL